MAYVLLCGLRRIGLAHTQFAEATCGTIRLKLLKLGALVRVSVRRSRSPWRRLVRGRTHSLWRTPDCAWRSPDTNRTGHSQHTDSAEIAAARRSAGIRFFLAATQDRTGIQSYSGTYATGLLVSMRNAGARRSFSLRSVITCRRRRTPRGRRRKSARRTAAPPTLDDYSNPHAG